MITLDATTKTLEIDLTGAVATNQLPFVASYVDISQSTFAMTAMGEQDGTSNNTNAVTCLSAPGASTSRVLKFFSWKNSDTAAREGWIQLNNNGTLREIWKGTLAVGDTLEFLDSDNWKVLDANGNLKYSSSIVIGGTVVGGTAGRVLYLDTGSVLANSANLTFNGTTLTAHTATISTGAFTVTGGSIKLTATGEITAGTADASDNTYVAIGGGGAISSTRGAQVIAYGNEHASTGQLRLAAGDVANGDVFGQTAALTRFVIKRSGSVLVGDESTALATNATDGFLYVPTCAGTPTGTPTAITGVAPIIINTSQNKLYFYSGGAWRDAGP